MDVKSLKERTPEGLYQDLQEVSDKLKTLEFKLSSNQVKNVREVRLLKKTIARINTLLQTNTSKI